MRLLSYIVARDFGFAPNPFYGYCTLATCKPKVRLYASIGDWIIGTGPKRNYNMAGHLIYAMKVEEAMDFDSYWNDPRFFNKRPVMNGSLKQLYGDNIYHSENGQWFQTDSHHSLDTGQPNLKNTAHDTKLNRVLISSKFIYYGIAAPLIPLKFRPYATTGKNLCCTGQGYRVIHDEFATEFETWLYNRDEWGVYDMPNEFIKHKRLYGNNSN